MAITMITLKNIADIWKKFFNRENELGFRTNPETATRYLYQQAWIDYQLRSVIQEIRQMDREDVRVKRIHNTTSHAAVKGGLCLRSDVKNAKIHQAWDTFVERVELGNASKLESHMRGLLVEGNLPLQWVLDGTNRVCDCVRMPTESIAPVVAENGRFKSIERAYIQYDVSYQKPIATFPLWQLTLVRLSPDNYDDMGSMGRPYLDAVRKTYQKLVMTEEDLVMRRRMRAPLRIAHVLDNATKEQLTEYVNRVESSQSDGICTDYYSNKKTSITPIQGDTNLAQIEDIIYLLDTFFCGAPGAHKELYGYVGTTTGDVFEPMLKMFYDEIDRLQDIVSNAYAQGFYLDLLLSGINPDKYEYEVMFAERRTETRNQAADLALKAQALGVDKQTVWEMAGLNPVEIKERLESEKSSMDFYPSPTQIQTPASPKPNVAVTPGNAPMGESATTISTRTKE